MKILLTGGSGYIGSFMIKSLLEDNHDVTVIDHLERGHKQAVDHRAKLIVGNIQDEAFLSSVFVEHFDAILHFAGYISMKESMDDPRLYFENNTFGTLKLLDKAHASHINKIIFSSTAGVYGNPVKTPIPEDHPKNPENPYGESKLMVEQILKWYQRIYHINFVALRYFNACGAALDGSMGEAHHPETHIIPNAIHAVLNNTSFNLFGNDYQTPDGTCVRDYIHVIDLVEAHMLALKKLEGDQGGFVYNVGTGNGYSNKEVVEMVKKISAVDLQVSMMSRRPGDADILVSDPTKINTELGFKPMYSDLETIVKTAWEWHKNKVQK